LAECGPDTVLVISGRTPAGMSAADVGVLVTEARRRLAWVVVDSSGPALIAAAEAGATVLKPNREELLDATGDATWQEGARRLLRAGAGTVVVSLGADGLVACSPRRMLRTAGIPAL